MCQMHYVLDGGPHSRHLANTSERSVLGGDGDSCKITLDACLFKGCKLTLNVKKTKIDIIPDHGPTCFLFNVSLWV